MVWRGGIGFSEGGRGSVNPIREIYPSRIEKSENVVYRDALLRYLAHLTSSVQSYLERNNQTRASPTD